MQNETTFTNAIHHHPSLKYAASRQFWLRHLLPALIFGLLMLLIYPYTSLDTRIADLFFDVQLHQFTFKKDPFLVVWMHVGLKWLIVTVALACLVPALLSYRLAGLKPYRLSFMWVFAGMVISTAAVAILKHYNQHGCPWDITLYGGHLPLFGLFTTAPAGVEAGRCFPAGHPSGGFALMAFYFAFMHSKPRFSVFMLGLGLLMGLLMGLAQMIRGAHFLSHVLWSGWVVWTVLLMLYWLWPVPQKTVLSH